MGLLDGVRTFARSLVSMPSWGSDLITLSALDDEAARLFGRSAIAAARTYRLPSVPEALGTPAIQRAVALIASTTGMLSLQGYRNGAVMDQPPGLISRPDPDLSPYEFCAQTSSNMAKYGEFVWWIASRDSDGLAAALVNVPLLELSVTPNPDDRRRPRYQWGTLTGTRWSPVNPGGIFVHVKYPTGDPFDLRGRGPLQLCNAATSISVESQAWAAQFYADGGDPSVIIKKAGFLSSELDDDGLSEADRLRAQWVDRPHNVPRVVDDLIESVEYKSPNTNAAQMLDARQHQNGDAARMYGIPGSLLEYQQPGSSLTYQNLEGEFTKLVRVCLQPLYLEPIEQALSDLLTRSTVARFNIAGYLRADIKTRFEVYQIAIASGVYGPDYAQRQEGITPGDVEFAPVPFREPSATPAPVPRIASMRDVRCPKCQRLLVRSSGSVEGWCRHCKSPVSDSVALAARPAEEPRPPIVVNVTTPEIHVSAPPVTFEAGAIHVESRTEPAHVTFAAGALVSGSVTDAQLETIGERVRLQASEAFDARLEQLKAPARPKRVVASRDESGRIVSATVEEVAEAS